MPISHACAWARLIDLNQSNFFGYHAYTDNVLTFSPNKVMKFSIQYVSIHTTVSRRSGSRPSLAAGPSLCSLRLQRPSVGFCVSRVAIICTNYIQHHFPQCWELEDWSLFMCYSCTKFNLCTVRKWTRTFKFSPLTLASTRLYLWYPLLLSVCVSVTPMANHSVLISHTFSETPVFIVVKTSYYLHV